MIRATLIALALAAPAHAATAPLDSVSLVNGLTYIAGIGFRPADYCSMRWQHHHHDSYRLRPSCTDQPYEGGKGEHLVASLTEGAAYTLEPVSPATTTPAPRPTRHTGGYSGGFGGTWGGDTIYITTPQTTTMPDGPSPVPLPASGLMLLAGLFGFIGWRRK